MKMKFSGNAWKYGDDVDTDVIIPARYLNTSDPDELAAHCMEDLDPNFVQNIQQGDILVAGKNFGCGSSREHAPIAIKAAGISCVIAASFARIFFRNAVNIGLPILESKEAAGAIETGHSVEVDLEAGRVVNVSQEKEFDVQPFPEFMQRIIDAGGLIGYVEKRIST